MARKQDPRWVFIGVGAAALAAVAVFFVLSGGGAKPPVVSTAPPALPSEPLRLVRDRLTEARYVSATPDRTGDLVRLNVLSVGGEIDKLEGGSALISQTKLFNCAKGRVFDGDVGTFDWTGRLLSVRKLAPGPLGRIPDTDEADEMAVACGPAPAGRPILVEGYRGAQLETQWPPLDFGEKAKPDDAFDMAWLCAAGARGRWRDEAPGDCRRAAKLTKGARLTALDQAFLNLKIGERAAAERQFMALEGDAAAMFGLNLLHALAGDEVGGRLWRGRALDADPQIAEWVVDRYELQISREYRER